MSTFMDDNMVPLSHDVVVEIASCGNGETSSSHWGAHVSPTLSGVAFEQAALGLDSASVYAATAAFLGVPPATAKSGYSKFGHSEDGSGANAWACQWSDANGDDYAPAVSAVEFGLGAGAAPGLGLGLTAAKVLAGMPAMPAFPGVGFPSVGSDAGLPGAVRIRDRPPFPASTYPNHIY